ncbi:MAG: acetolactate synthase small subunit [Gammaproteobacteria bacterium]|nr:acetolactate synthase small subunit [Gammaproteobacteria bacterium]
MRHIISVLMENEAGALSRVAGLFSARNFNIESLTVAPTQDPTLSRMTIVTTGNDSVIEQITKQLNKLIDVVKLVDLTDSSYLERELMLVKLYAVGEVRDEVMRLVDIYRCKILDVSPTTLVVEVTGASKKLDSFLSILKKDAVIEVVRSGATGVARGEKALTV